LVLDVATEELLGRITQKIADIEKKLKVLSNQMDLNRIRNNNKSHDKTDDKLNIKSNKKLKETKKKLLSRKVALEKE
jgi:hypothetical protein